MPLGVDMLATARTLACELYRVHPHGMYPLVGERGCVDALAPPVPGVSGLGHDLLLMSKTHRCAKK